MSSKGWIIFIAICVVLFGGLVIWSGRDRVDVAGVDLNSIQPASSDSGDIGEHVYGNKDAKVVLIEYGDFQCPGCGSAHPIVKDLSEKYEDQMAFVYRNFPLTSIHPNARAAAAAAEAAGIQGKYWEVHNALFENQDEWSDASTEDRGDVFARYAEQSGLDKAAFSALLTDRSADINKKINFDIALGRKANVSGTPTFFLNGTLLDSEQFNSKESFENALLEEFKKQNVPVPESADTDAATK
jgi:protein-disulfide isomerase